MSSKSSSANNQSVEQILNDVQEGLNTRIGASNALASHVTEGGLFSIENITLKIAGASTLEILFNSDSGITKLVLDTVSIEADALPRFTSALKACASLKSLKMNNCSLSEDEACDIARAVSSLDRIEELNFKSNDIRGVRFLNVLQNVPLKKIDLSNNLIDTECASDIATFVTGYAPALESFTLKNTPLSAKASSVDFIKGAVRNRSDYFAKLKFDA
jgi:hypothetical protein